MKKTTLNIRKIMVAMLWIAFASGLMVLLVAAINKKESKSCKAVEVSIQGSKGYYFLDKKDVLDLLGIDKKNRWVGRPISSFHLQKQETILEVNPWIKDAELYFDNNLVLHINVKEREPVARIYTIMGSSFYIDSSGKKMPLSDKWTERLPSFANFTSDKTTGLNKADKQLLADIKKLSVFLLKDTLWMGRIAQINIVQDSGFEMIPATMNYIIAFGNGENYETKFHKLGLFYNKILSKTGFDKYSRIDVRFENQVVGTRKGIVTKVDSLQAIFNIQKMIRESTKIPDDSLSTPVENNNPIIQKSEATSPVKDNNKSNSKDISNTKQSNNLSKNPITTITKNPLNNSQTYPSNFYAKPKAVMRKK